MKVFISWSGERSKRLAEGVRKWLPLILPYVEPWMSEADIQAGERWAQSVAKELAASDFGIICVTSENVTSPWMLFEAGALTKSLESGRVIPLLVDLEFSDVSGPLAQFQAKKLSRGGIEEVIKSLQKAADDPIPERRANELFDALWPKFQKKLDSIPGEPPTVRDVLGAPATSANGLAIVFPVFSVYTGEDCNSPACAKIDPNSGDVRAFRKRAMQVLAVHDFRGVVRLIDVLRRIHGEDVPFVSDEDERLVDWWQERSLVCVGGPLTNLVSRRALRNRHNKLVEIDDKTYTITLPTKNKVFSTDDSRRREYAIAGCFASPVNQKNRVLLCAGLADIGTEAACIHVSRRLIDYARIFKGVSFVEVLEIKDGQLDAPDVVETVIADVAFQMDKTESEQRDAREAAASVDSHG